MKNPLPVFILGLALLGAGPLWAQPATTQLQLQVLDWRNQAPVAGATVELAPAPLAQTYSADSSTVTFELVQGATYCLSAQKFSAPLNGLSVADLLRLSNSLLGSVDSLTSSWLNWVGDVNLSTAASPTDFSLLRDVLLDRQTPPATPFDQWVFLASVYPDLADCAAGAGAYTTPVGQATATATLYSLRAGDLDADAVSQGDYVPGATLAQLRLHWTDRTVATDEVVDIPIGVLDNRRIAGLQLAWFIDPQRFAWEGISSGQLALPDETFYAYQPGSGVLRLVWSEVSPGSELLLQPQSSPLFTVRVRALQPGNLSDGFMPLSADLAPRWANAQFELGEVVWPQVTATRGPGRTAVASMQVFPNPTPSACRVEAPTNWPVHAHAQLSLTDLAGRQLRHWQVNSWPAEFSLAGLPQGVYVLDLRQPHTDELWARTRVVKQ